MRRLFVLLVYAPLFAQSPAFDAASIKPHEGPMPRIGATTSGSILTCDACNLRSLATFAYNLRNAQLTGSAPLLDQGNTRWDIVAKASGAKPPTLEEFRAMLRTLLADRFQLEARIEPRETNVYALVVAKNGPKLKPSPPDAERYHRSGPRDGSRNNHMTIHKGDIAELVFELESSAFLDRPVVDRTNLTGPFEMELIYTPEYRANKTTPEPDEISVFSALESQLGLRLEPQKAMLDMLVVTHATAPSAN